MMNSEQTLWSGTPSQVLNLPALILGILFASLVTVVAMFTAVVTGPLALILIAAGWIVGLAPWAVKCIATRFDRYELTTERLKHRAGVLNRSIEVLELYRVKDMRFEFPFHFRIFGLGRILMETSDRSTPFVVLNAIRNADEVGNLIRTHVEIQRDKKRVREVDFEGDDLGA